MQDSISDSHESFHPANRVGEANTAEWTDTEEAAFAALAATQRAAEDAEAVARTPSLSCGEFPAERFDQLLSAYTATQNAAAHLEELIEEFRPDDDAPECHREECDGRGRFDPEAGRVTGAASIMLHDPVPVKCMECGEAWAMGEEGGRYP